MHHEQLNLAKSRGLNKHGVPLEASGCCSLVDKDLGWSRGNPSTISIRVENDTEPQVGKGDVHV